MNFALQMRFADAAGDELRDLGAEVEDEDFLVSHGANVSYVKKRKGGFSAARKDLNCEIN